MVRTGDRGNPSKRWESRRLSNRPHGNAILRVGTHGNYLAMLRYFFLPHGTLSFWTVIQKLPCGKKETGGAGRGANCVSRHGKRICADGSFFITAR